MQQTTEPPSSNRPPRVPRGGRDSRKHTPKADMRGLYKRAIKESFVKLNPRTAVRNPVMFIVWVGTIVTFLVTLFPNLFGTVQADPNQQRLLNGLITLILFFTVLFANFAEAVAEGRGKAQADSLKATRTDTVAPLVMPTGFEKKSKTETSFTPSVDSSDITSKFQEYFTNVKDPRVERTRWHLLTDIITISILAVIAGAEGWEDIEEYGLNKKEWLETFLELPFGIPSPDTFRRVFEKINPKETD